MSRAYNIVDHTLIKISNIVIGLSNSSLCNVLWPEQTLVDELKKNIDEKFKPKIDALYLEHTT